MYFIYLPSLPKNVDRNMCVCMSVHVHESVCVHVCVCVCVVGGNIGSRYQ